MSRRRGGNTPHPLEWSIGVVSALLVAALFGFVLVEAIQETTRIPELSARVEAIDTATGGRFRVRFTAVNAGNATAAAVEITGTLASPDGEIETSGVTLDYVPAFSQASGWLMFDADPHQGRLAVSPRGFAEP